MTFECVKCGHFNESGLTECRACKWPMALHAWERSSHQIRRITLDTSCMNAKQRDPYLNTLEMWRSQGRLELQRSQELMKELKGAARIAKAQNMGSMPAPYTLGSSSLVGGPDVLAGPVMREELHRILFPTTKKLTPGQQRDVDHLAEHVRTGDDIFVTLDSSDFMKNSKQVSLRRYGIWVLTPEEIVVLLQKLYNWS